MEEKIISKQEVAKTQQKRAELQKEAKKTKEYLSDYIVQDIEEIEDYIQIFKHKIENDIINYYIVDTFSLLSGKAIEHYSKIKSEKQITFLLQMKNVLKRENVQNILNKNKNIDEKLNSENNNENLDSK